MLERELKILLNADQYAKICAFIDKQYQGQCVRDKQVNYYYDTEDGCYNQKGVTIRVRRKNGTLKGTIKTHSVQGENCSEEMSFDVDRVPVALYYEERYLKLRGKLITNRISVKPNQGGLLLCLDENLYLGHTDYELEIEYQDIDETSANNFVKILECGIGEELLPFVKGRTKTKSERYFDYLYSTILARKTT